MFFVASLSSPFRPPFVRRHRLSSVAGCCCAMTPTKPKPKPKPKPKEQRHQPATACRCLASGGQPGHLPIDAD
ncbi:MAG: hypothetical protein N7Q72_04850, partial [Spiroplasma sp. Tabriz.8]|nr:hypothetical protein [Spiroplasma sp. Tabriz.8]